MMASEEDLGMITGMEERTYTGGQFFEKWQLLVASEDRKQKVS